MQETNKPQYAGFFVRLSAAVIDGIIVFMLLLLVRLPIWVSTFWLQNNPLDKEILFRFSTLDIVVYLLATTYYVLMLYYGGATIGKKLLKLKVVGEEGRLSFFTVLYRETIGKYISTAIMFIGFFLIGVDSQKRGLHDILCDTWVVYNFEEKRNEQALSRTYLSSSYAGRQETRNDSEMPRFAGNDSAASGVAEMGNDSRESGFAETGNKSEVSGFENTALSKPIQMDEIPPETANEAASDASSNSDNFKKIEQ